MGDGMGHRLLLVVPLDPRALRPIEDGGFQRLDLVLRRFLQVFGILGIERRPLRGETCGYGASAAALQGVELAQAALQALAAAAERAVDRFR